MARPSLTHQPLALVLIWILAASGAAAIIVRSGRLLEGGLAITAGIGLAILLQLANSQSPGGRATASVVTIITGVVLTGAIGLTAITGVLTGEFIIPLFITTALVLTAWGASGAATTGLDPQASRDALKVLVVTAFPISVYLIVLIQSIEELSPDDNDTEPVLAALPTDQLAELIELLIAPEADMIGALTLGVLLVAVLLTISYTVPRLTILSLLSQSHREPIERGLDQLRTYCNHVIVHGFVALVVGGVSIIGLAVIRLNFPEWEEDIESFIAAAEAMLFALGGSAELRWLLLVIAGLFWGAWVLSVIPAVPRIRHHPLVAWIPTAIGGFGVIIGIHFGYPALFERRIDPQLQEYVAAEHHDHELLEGTRLTVEELTMILSPPIGQSVVAASMIIMLAIVLLFIGSITLLKKVGVIRERGGTGSIAGSALIGAALVLGVDGASIFTIGIPLVLGIAIWDLTRYADGLVDELGAAPTTVAPILIHGVATIVVGLLLLGFVILIEKRPIEIEPALTAPVVGLLAIAIVMFFVALNIHSRRLAD